MTDQEIGRNYFQYTNRGWRHPTPWESLPKEVQQLWINRALKTLKEQQDGGKSNQ